MKRLDRWQPLIREARTDEAIVALMREYLALWSSDDLARLPADCRPTDISTGTEVSQWAVVLARTERTFRGEREVEILLDQMANVFTAAADRLREIW